jgi:membrane fusion protein, multidrug efflux system
MDEKTSRIDRLELERGSRPALREPTSPAPGRIKSPKRGRRFWLGLILLLALASGVYEMVHLYQVPQRRATRATPPSQAVGAATIGRGDIRIIVNALGTVTPLATVSVKTQINGQLTEVAFVEGQMVRKGDFLAQIDPRPYQAAIQQAEGQLAHDQGLLDQAKMDLARYDKLAKTQAIPRQQDEDQIYLVKQYEGSVKTDQALIDTQKLNLVYCHVVSPVDGRVGLRLVDPGNYVQTTDASGIAVITQLRPISVIFSVPEDDLPQIMAELQAGATLQVTAFDRSNVTQLATGRVSTLDNQIDTTTGTVKLRAQFDNSDDKLFPNQFVNMQLLVKSLHDVVTAPTSAIQRGAPGTYAYVINADGTVSVSPIKLGPTDGTMVTVDSGLAPGDRVVVDGADRLRDGARVIVPGNQLTGARTNEDAQPGGAPQGRSPSEPDSRGPGSR